MRPKLSGWGKKLASLLQEGRGIEERKDWSKEEREGRESKTAATRIEK
jgi:hypothetical protein